MGQLLHVMPSPFPGVLYDGDGTLLAGDGPALFQDDLVDAYPFKTMVHRQLASQEAATFREGDRLWLLPDDLDTSVLPIPILAELVVVVHGEGRVGVGGRVEAAVKHVCDALGLLLTASKGNA